MNPRTTVQPYSDISRSDTLPPLNAEGVWGSLNGQGEGSGPFLVLEGRMDARPEGPWSLREDECRLAGVSAVDWTTGEIAWSMNCGSARCYRCSRIVSARSFAIARRAMQEGLEEGSIPRVRFITLTLAPDEWQDVRTRMRRLAEYLRRRGIEVRWLWVVETGKQTGMKHIHAVQWGDFIPWRDLLGWWGARVNIQSADAALGYLGKSVIGYLGKGIDGDREAIEAHMNLNGGRAAHWSRGFFNGMGRDEWAAAHPLPGIYFLRGIELEAWEGGEL